MTSRIARSTPGWLPVTPTRLGSPHCADYCAPATARKATDAGSRVLDEVPPDRSRPAVTDSNHLVDDNGCGDRGEDRDDRRRRSPIPAADDKPGCDAEPEQDEDVPDEGKTELAVMGGDPRAADAVE